MLDIDHFKEINDTYGHTVGDEIIRALAHVARGSVCAGDCTGYYDGDEFTIIPPGIHAHDTLATAQRIREQAEGARLHSLLELRITSNVGVAPTDHRHSSLRAWINATDTALYAVKNGGRNQVAGHMKSALVPTVQQPTLRPMSRLVDSCKIHRSLYPRRATSARHRCRANLYAMTLRNGTARCELRAHPLKPRLMVQTLEYAERGVFSFSVQQLTIRKSSTGTGVVLIDR